MVLDEQIMGLCGETRIANKVETFATMVSTTKAFESRFSGVTCFQYVSYLKGNPSIWFLS